MATETQYNFFKAVYDEENKRYTRLGNRATLYFSIISFFLGTIIFKFNDLKPFLALFHVPMALYLVIGLLFGLSLIFTVFGIIVRRYEGICDLTDIIRNMGVLAPTDADFLDDRIIDLAVATKRNKAQNGRVALLLRCSAYPILGAVCVQFLVFIVALAGRM